MTAQAEAVIPASPERVRAVLSDYPARARWLPEEYSDVRLESDGSFAYRLSVGGRVRDYRMRPELTEAGPLERDIGSSLVTCWRVDAAPGGSRVQISTSWRSAGGVGGIFERTFAPRALGRLHRKALQGLAEECR